MGTDTDFLTLLRDEGLQQLMLLACPDGIVVTGPNGRILLFSGAAEQLFDTAAVDVSRRDAAMLFADEESYRAFMAEVKETGRVSNFELQAINCGGVPFPAAVSAAVLKDRYGDEIATVMYVRDHSKVRTIQESLRKNNTQLNKLVSELGYMAQHDQMTGLLNRGSAFQRAEEALVHLRGAAAFGVVLIDVDNFKRINDSYGHLVGDKALSSIARALAGTTRDGDIVGRFGGEEFVVFLPGSDLARSAAFAERTRIAIEATTVEVKPDARIRMTISCGVAALPDCTDTLNDAIRVADNRLLTAKRDGKNCVVKSDERGRSAA